MSKQTVITSGYLEGILEHLGGMGTFMAYLIESQSTGILEVGGAKLHLECGIITHLEHERLFGMTAALDVAQRQTGHFKFVKSAVVQHTTFLNANAVLLEAMRLLDERQNKYLEMVVPDIESAMICAQGLAPLVIWSVYETDYQHQKTTIMALDGMKIIILSGNLGQVRKHLLRAGFTQDLPQKTRQANLPRA